MSIKLLLTAAAVSLAAVSAKAQVSINNTGNAPHVSAMLDVQSTTRGALLPRMTQAQRDLIATPATGLLIYQTNNTPGYYYNSGTPVMPYWMPVGSTGAAAGTVDYIPRFGATGLIESSLIDSDYGLFYNKPVTSSYLASIWFKSKPQNGNWLLHEGNLGGFTFMGVMDSTDYNKGFMIGKTNNVISSNTSTALIYYKPVNTSLNLANNLYDYFSINLTNGRMGYNNNTGAHLAINSTYDTAALFTSSSSNYLSSGILRAEYTGTITQDHVAVFGKSQPDIYSDYGIGIRGEGGWKGVTGYATNYSTSGFPATGVYAEGASNGSAVGIEAYALSLGTTGGTKYGVVGFASGGATNYAGYFEGNVQVIGNLAKSSGTFKIDHPQDPENKYLYHSFVESPDMMNIYNGNITTDANGFAIVTLPQYFEALNKDFRYSLTVIGTFAQAIVKEKVSGNKFIIQTNQPNVEVSWQVTGIRQDAYANAHRVQPEVAKEPENRGKYLNPTEWGKPETLGQTYELTHQSREREAKNREHQHTPQTLPAPDPNRNILGKPTKK